MFAGGLHAPSTATVVRRRDGDVLMTAGPFAESKEHVGGFTIIEAAVPGRHLIPGVPALPAAEIDRVFRAEYGRAV